MPSSCAVSTCLASLLLQVTSLAPATARSSPSATSSSVTVRGIIPGTIPTAPPGSRSSQSQTMWPSVSWGRVKRRVVSTSVATVLPPALSLPAFFSPSCMLRCSSRNRLGLNGCHTSRLAWPNRTSNNLSAPSDPLPLLLFEEWRRQIKMEALSPAPPKVARTSDAAAGGRGAFSPPPSTIPLAPPPLCRFLNSASSSHSPPTPSLAPLSPKKAASTILVPSSCPLKRALEAERRSMTRTSPFFTAYAT
mmetsp:Transcript_26899/g.57203  ORF Transcript_26899/g.57203 Transcript_26899/m.57203 type:complete len:249 (-) Transcript_26899:286-1032(-)